MHESRHLAEDSTFLTCGVSRGEWEMEMERFEALGFFHHNLRTLQVQR